LSPILCIGNVIVFFFITHFFPLSVGCSFFQVACIVLSMLHFPLVRRHIAILVHVTHHDFDALFHPVNSSLSLIIDRSLFVSVPYNRGGITFAQ
jgi:hypothetical protein